MHFDIPKELTKEVYVQVIRKLLACVRREAYFEIQKMLHDPSNRRDKLTAEEVEDLLAKITETTQEGYRAKALELYGVPVPTGQVPKRVMQKAYLVFSTISTLKNEDGTPIKAKWQDQISHEHKVHSEIIDKLAKGERVEGIETDPLESKDADYSYDYNVVPGFLRKETSTSGDIYHLQPHGKSIQHVEALLAKHKAKKAAKLAGEEVEDSQAIIEEVKGDESEHGSK